MACKHRTEKIWLVEHKKEGKRGKKQKTAAQFARWEIKALNYEHHHCFGFNSLLTEPLIVPSLRIREVSASL